MEKLKKKACWGLEGGHLWRRQTALPYGKLAKPRGGDGRSRKGWFAGSNAGGTLRPGDPPKLRRCTTETDMILCPNYTVDCPLD